MSAAFGLMLAVFVAIALLRGPVGLAMIAGGIAYLGATGQDMGLAAEQILNSLFGSFVLIAVPMFIFAANVMNSGTLSERLYGLAHALMGRFRGGLYSGVFPPPEAAAVAALYALALALFVYRARDWKGLVSVLADSARFSAVVGISICGAFLYKYVLATEQVPVRLAEWFLSLELGPLGFLIVANLVFLVLGCLLDTTTLLLVLVPLLLPIARALGVDLVHFGVVIVLNMMIGLLTPPYGVLLFVLSGLTGTPVTDIVRELVPFILALLAVLFLITFVPSLVLALPELAGYVR